MILLFFQDEQVVLRCLHVPQLAAVNGRASSLLGARASALWKARKTCTKRRSEPRGNLSIVIALWNETSVEPNNAISVR